MALVAAFLLVGAGCSKSSATLPDAASPAAVNATVTGPGAADAPATNGATSPTPAAAALNAPRTATIALKNVSGGSSQAGTVTLTDLPGNSTRVDIVLTGTKSKSAQPAAIYSGSCATQSAEPQYALNPVVNGKSSTTLAVNIGAILDKTPQALKVREDGTTPNLPFAVCGDLK